MNTTCWFCPIVVVGGQVTLLAAMSTGGVGVQQIVFVVSYVFLPG
jgi:hypothetical protein